MRSLTKIRKTSAKLNQSYRTNLTNEQWEIIKILIPAAKLGGRPRTCAGAH